MSLYQDFKFYTSSKLSFSTILYVLIFLVILTRSILSLKKLRDFYYKENKEELSKFDWTLAIIGTISGVLGLLSVLLTVIFRFSKSSTSLIRETGEYIINRKQNLILDSVFFPWFILTGILYLLMFIGYFNGCYKIRDENDEVNWEDILSICLLIAFMILGPIFWVVNTRSKLVYRCGEYPSPNDMTLELYNKLKKAKNSNKNITEKKLENIVNNYIVEKRNFFKNCEKLGIKNLWRTRKASGLIEDKDYMTDNALKKIVEQDYVKTFLSKMVKDLEAVYRKLELGQVVDVAGRPTTFSQDGIELMNVKDGLPVLFENPVYGKEL